MPTEERVQGRCGQQRRGEDQGRGESGAWGPSAAALAVPHLPEQSQRSVWSAQAQWCGFGFHYFALITKAVRVRVENQNHQIHPQR